MFCDGKGKCRGGAEQGKRDPGTEREMMVKGLGASRLLTPASRLSISNRLHPEQFRVQAVRARELLVRSFFDNLAALEHDNAVCHSDR